MIENVILRTTNQNDTFLSIPIFLSTMKHGEPLKKTQPPCRIHISLPLKLHQPWLVDIDEYFLPQLDALTCVSPRRTYCERSSVARTNVSYAFANLIAINPMKSSRRSSLSRTDSTRPAIYSHRPCGAGALQGHVYT